MEEVEDVEEVVERATAWWGAARWCCRVIVRARYRNINMIYKVKEDIFRFIWFYFEG